MFIGERIKNRRIELGMTQGELADKMGYKSRSAISKVETIEDNLTTDRIREFADALNVSPSYLMGWEDKKVESKLPPLNPILSDDKVGYFVRSEYELSLEEVGILKAYRNCSDSEKDMIKRMLRYEEELNKRVKK